MIRPKDQMPVFVIKPHQPQRGVPVLITDKEGLQTVAWWDSDYDKWYSENHSWFPDEVLYWMPIPEIPKP